MFFRNTIKELKSDIRELNKRIEQLECPHDPQCQEVKKDVGYYFYGVKVCNQCGKIINRYVCYVDFMLAQNKQMQEQIKRNKAILRVK